MNRLFVSPSGDGWRNLGTDEYFLDHLASEDVLLHFYVNRSAVIIGRGQNPWAECNLEAMRRDDVQLVRRISGGGAVFHDEGNLNFSFIAGEGIYDVQRQLGMILSAVRALGINEVQFGIVYILTSSVGTLTPPLGTVMFTVCNLTGVKTGPFVKATAPFYLCLLMCILLLIFVPPITLILPNLVFGAM